MLVLNKGCFRYKELDVKKEKRKQTFYETYIKRGIDVFLGILALVTFWWLYLIVALLVKINLGSPVIFKQQRPGLHESIFPLYKFLTMTDELDVASALVA